MISPAKPTPQKKPSLREQVRNLERIVAMYERGNSSQKEAMDKMAENMTHLIVRLEAVRAKFGISVETVNALADEYIAKMSELQENKDAAAAGVKLLQINGVEYRPASAPMVAPLRPPAPSTPPANPADSNPAAGQD